MPEVQIKQSDLESLAQKLGSAESQLSESERAMLSTVVALAADAISRTGVGKGADGSGNPPASRVSGHKTPPLAAGLAAALLLASPIAASAVAAEMRDSLPSLRAEFVNAFTPGAINAPPECCSVKLPPE